MAKFRVLFVEDDPVLGYTVTQFLQEQNFEVTQCDNSESAWVKFMRNCYDICLFDIMLPGKNDGIDLAKNIRSKNENIPILLMSAESIDEIKIKGFDNGADDYIIKPFNYQELTRRMNVFLKRSSKIEDEQPVFFKIEDMEFDYINLSLKFKDERLKIQLTKREADILRYLCMNANRLIKRDELLIKIWGNTDYFLGRSMDVFMGRLRKYLKSQKGVSIETVKGIGLKFNYQKN